MALINPVTRRRIALAILSLLTVAAIVGTVVIGFIVDRTQCKSAAQAIHNSRTMWEYAVQQNPGPEADKFLAELNHRIPPAHCEGGRLIIDTPPSTTTEAP